MKTSQIISHTADLRLFIEASSKKELFCVAIEAISKILKKEDLNKLEIEQIINLNSYDLTALLIDFMSEVLTLSYTNKAIFYKVEIQSLTDKKIISKIFGQFVDGFDEDIKAVTYHEAEIKKNDQGNFETMIVFDI